MSSDINMLTYKGGWSLPAYFLGRAYSMIPQQTVLQDLYGKRTLTLRNSIILIGSPLRSLNLKIINRNRPHTYMELVVPIEQTFGNNNLIFFINF